MCPQMKKSLVNRGVEYNPFKADVYSLGTTLIKLIALSFPAALQCEYNSDTTHKVVSELQCSEQLKFLLLGMLAYEEDSRPSMQEVYDAVTSEQLPEQIQQANDPVEENARVREQLSVREVPRDASEPLPVQVRTDLVHVERDAVNFFHFPSKTWERVPFTSQIEVDDFTQYVWTTAGLFCCGGNYNSGLTDNESIKKAYIIAEGEWNPYSCADMSESRYNQGVWWDAAQGYVLVFGGESASQNHTRSLAECERWSLNTDTWSALPSMAKPRWRFNPCEFRLIVYLCGGYTDLIEAFDPQTSTFSVLTVRFPALSSSSVSIVSENRLVVLSSKFETVYDLEGKQLQEVLRARHGDFEVWSNMAPSLDAEEKQIYVAYKKVCWSYQLGGFGNRRIESR